MHRSGPSAVAHRLKTLGINLDDNLMKVIPSNKERRFWENLKIYHFNESLLNKTSKLYLKNNKLLAQDIIDSHHQYMELQHFILGKLNKIKSKLKSTSAQRDHIQTALEYQQQEINNLFNSHSWHIRTPLKVFVNTSCFSF